MMPKMPESQLAHKYCKGKGIEIGASAHNPFGLDTINVDAEEIVEGNQYYEEQMKFCGDVAKVDVIARGDELPFEDASFDFVVTSHIIEHFPNPIKALLEWDRVTKPGGILFMIVPHRERTFDRFQPPSTLYHVVEAYKQDVQTEFATDRHYNAWGPRDFDKLIHWIMENTDVHWKIECVREKDDKVGNGFTYVLRKLK